MNNAPEDDRGTTGQGRAIGPARGNLTPGQAGSVRALSSADRLGFSSEVSRLKSCAIRLQLRDSPVTRLPAKARDGGERRERSERRGAPPELVRGGGRERRVREDGTAADGRRPTGGEREAVWSAEVVPSAGWRSVAVALGVEEGCSHR